MEAIFFGFVKLQRRSGKGNQTQTTAIVQFLDLCFNPHYISNTILGLNFFLFILNLCNLRMEKLIRMRSFFSFFGSEEFLFVSLSKFQESFELEMTFLCICCTVWLPRK